MELKIEDGITEIKASAYAGNAELERVVIPASVQKIGTGAFKDCILLSSIRIAEGNMPLEIGESAFEGCKALKEIELPARCSRFLNACFKNSGLTKLSIVEQGGDYIAKGFYLFSGCPGEQTLGTILEDARLARLKGLSSNAKKAPAMKSLII